MTPRLFFQDTVKSILLSAILGFAILWVILTLMQSAGTLWWLYAWLFWVGLSFTLMALFPRFIAPLFNKFTPLEEGELRQRIEGLLTRGGFASQGIFIMDGSKRSSHGNAYFTGMGKSKRIVFFDTLISQLDPDEIEAVLAHELGHFKRKHITKRLLTSFLLMLALFAVLGLLIAQPWFYQGLGVSTMNNATALTLFFMVIPVFTFLFTPISSHLSRKHEFEADAYASEESSADKLISALVKLYRDNASPLQPDPLHSLFYDSHPPANVRITALRRQH
jgi:STE24 endopeptidase